MSPTARVGLMFAVSAIVASPLVACTPPPPTFANCKLMNLQYPHGVGKVHAVDHVSSGKPVTTFYRSDALYNANIKSDRDHDGVACEKR